MFIKMNSITKINSKKFYKKNIVKMLKVPKYIFDILFVKVYLIFSISERNEVIKPRYGG